MFDPRTDPNGRALKQRTQDVYDDERQQIQAGPQDAFSVMHLQANQRNAMSPMAPWFQAFNEAEAASGKKFRLAGGLSPYGSTQLRGESVQPDEYTLTSYGNPAGMTQGAAQGAARKFAQGGSTPDWYQGATEPTQDMFRARVSQYKPSMRSLKG